MASRENVMESSLLPYLDARSAGIAIQFDEKAQQPVPPIGPGKDGGTYALVRWGRVMVDGAGPIAELMFLFQADRYGAGESKEAPATNADVERRWQQTLGRWANIFDATGAKAPFLRDDAAGVFQPWRSLFHCSHIDAFCHPLCPNCGRGLTLCRDDVLLQKAGLPSYSASLKRFLHCPRCHANGDAPLLYARSSMAHLPANVRHSRHLIQSFSRLLPQKKLARELPCVQCRHAPDCYGQDALALKRMRPFQFYPFHMLAHPAQDTSTVDIIDLFTWADADAGAESPGRQPDRQADDRPSGGIIADIERHWDGPGNSPPVAKPTSGTAETTAGQLNEDGDYEETVILESDPAQKSTSEAVPTGKVPATDPDQTLAKPDAATAQPLENPEETIPVWAYDDAAAEPDLEGTLVLAPREELTAHIHPGKTIGIRTTISGMPKEDLEKAPATQEDNELEKTLVLAPSETSPGSGGTKSDAILAPPPPPATEEDDELEKTLVIAPKAASPGLSKPVPGAKPAPPPTMEEDDELEKTLVLAPTGATPGPAEPWPGAIPASPPPPEQVEAFENALAAAAPASAMDVGTGPVEDPAPDIDGDLPDTLSIRKRDHNNGKD